MEEFVFDNGVKLIYKYIESDLTSICISLNAGAGVEEDNYGVAHATEHMVYKGTKNRSEEKINEDLSNIFGFNNAMTNYPYVIYYGTLLKDDFEKGLDLLGDIIINPAFKEDGFKEEMDVIKEELKEWDEELEQYCEDMLFFNSFHKRRIKYPIIGTGEGLDKISLNDIKYFYEKHYFPANTSIVIISSLTFENVKNTVNELFGSWEKRHNGDDISVDYSHIQYETPKNTTFKNYKEGIKTCKIQIVAPIDKLNNQEIKALKLFNQYFGEGVNSIIYDILRTKNGLIYDVISKISYENYIKLYKIVFSTSQENVNKSIHLIQECINKLRKNSIDNSLKINMIKNLKLKKLFREEQSIVLAKELATYDTMFGDYKIYLEEIENLEKINIDDIIEVGIKVLENITIQIIDKK